MSIGDIIIYLPIFFSLYISLLFIFVSLERRNRIGKTRTEEQNKNYARVCIIVPCFNEEKTVVKTVLSLINSDYPKDKLEIFVVDDGSTDKTFELAKSLEKYKQVKVFHKENGGKYTALNYGITKTKAEFVGCVDADCFIEPKALKIIMSSFVNHKIMAVTSSIKVDKPGNILQRIQRVEYIFGVFLRNTFASLHSIFITPGAFCVFRKKTFEELGLFRKGYNTEDMEIAFRIQSKNYQIVNAPDACAHTVCPSSFKELCQQRKRWNYGLVRNAWDYRYLTFNKKYGDLGIFIFPSTFLLIFILLVANLYILFQLGQNIIYGFFAWQAIGFSFSPMIFQTNWFFINTQTHMFLGVLLIAITYIFVLIGKKISSDKPKITKDFLIFILLYGPLSFIWWIIAIYNVAFSRENKW